jgi:hypothetical protein
MLQMTCSSGKRLYYPWMGGCVSLEAILDVVVKTETLAHYLSPY